MPLTQEERTELEVIIRREHKRLMNELRRRSSSRGGNLRRGRRRGGHSADESVADLLSDLDAAEITRDVNEIRELEAARARLAAGTYGRCVDCETDIPVARLRAQPAALRCVACQASREDARPPARAEALTRRS